MISRLLQLLREGGADGAGPEELADVLWLAHHVLSAGEQQPGEGRGTSGSMSSPSSQDDGTADEYGPSGAAHRPQAALHDRAPVAGGDERTLAAAVRVPAEAALPHSLELARALRPLTRKVPSRTAFELDEEETVTRLVDEHIMVPVLRPRPSRWLTLTLVVDTGPSMRLWQQEIREFVQGLTRLGAFRDIRRWNLSGEDGGHTVALRPHPSAGRPPRHHREIVDPAGDQLILVLSDTVGAIWRTGAAERLLVDWAHRSQVALAHLLPARLWNRGGAVPAPLSLRIPHPGAPNARWKTASPQRRPRSREPVVPVPVIELEPRPLRDWAELTTGDSGWRQASSLLLPHRPTSRRGTEPSRSPRERPHPSVPLPADEALIRFHLSASRGAWELAGLLSALSIVTLPVARLVQRAMSEDPSRGHLAELFLGGILHRVPVTAALDDGEPRFTFPPGVRDALLNAQYADDVRKVRALVREKVAAYLEPRYGTPRDFAAALTGVDEGEGSVPYVGEAFATASSAAVRRLGKALQTAGAAQETGAGRQETALFVNYAGADRAWAEWIAWQLQDAGYVVELGLRSVRPDSVLAVRMHEAVEGGGTVVALLSAAYFGTGRWTGAEWDAVRWPDRGGAVLLRLDDTPPPPVLAPLAVRDLFGLDEDVARRVLLEAVRGAVPATEPLRRPARVRRPDTGTPGPRMPGTSPEVSHLPARNAQFVGRDELLLEIKQLLADAPPPSVVALQGPVGVGKTQLACEYAHRFAGDYDVVWWISAEDPVTIREGLARMAAAVGRGSGTGPEEEPQPTGRWLLVFDDAQTPEAVEPFLPAGPGHVLIISRSGEYTGPTVRVGPFHRREAVSLLRGRIPELSRRDAERLSERLDDHPLLLAQVAAYLATASVTAEEYLALLGESDGTFAQAIRASRDRLRAEEPDALDFLNACALLAPEPFHLPEVHNPGPRTPAVLSGWHTRSRVLEVLSEHALLRVSDDSVEIYGSVFSALRDSLTPAERERAAVYACHLLEASYTEPGGRADRRTFPSGLLPHLLAIAPGDLVTGGARRAACNACLSLRERDPVAALSRLRDLHLSFLERLGHDHADTLLAASGLVTALTDSGETEQALVLTEDLLTSRRRLLGEDHPDSLSQALAHAALLATVGRLQEAADLHRETRERLRRILGPDHPLSLDAAHALAENLVALGRTAEANSLVRDTLNRRRRVLGLDHPDSVRTARLFMSLNE